MQWFKQIDFFLEIDLCTIILQWDVK
ncbi:hypothetical protein Golax_023390 [Gossypium laxum]|uniref:Uncharacterized protein n=1 Tax=Gossypium laxum TaxID=34288 RepID=A0A7J9AZP8_9ROSI|nr:hypothetical protein [Gossypium laxum]